MFAYLLIIVELSILASVYWYVFVREPKPYEIKENIWGYYDQTVTASTGYGINSMPSLVSKKARRVKRVVHTVLLRSARHGIRRKEVAAQQDLKKGWTQSAESRRVSILSTLLAFLGDKLTQLSVKVSQ